MTPGNLLLSLSWVAVSGATSYEIWYDTTDNSATPVKFGGDVTATSATVTGLANGATYYVWLKAKNGGSVSGFGPATIGCAIKKAGFAAAGVSFGMTKVPGGLSFPTDVDDSGTATVAKAYWMGETEVTYELWQAVYAWATDAARGVNRYYFANAGIQGDNGSRGVQHPLTTVNCRDAVVWCNALTEWYNAQAGTAYDCVYTYAGSIVRDSRASNAGACDNAAAGAAATGFRLPTGDEWELAARWRIDSANTVSGYANPYFTKGNSASGAQQSMSPVAIMLVAWTNENSGFATHAVKGLAPNSLGLYDMSGNVAEWCFTKISNLPITMGGSYDSSYSEVELWVGKRFNRTADTASECYGFRVARTQ